MKNTILPIAFSRSILLLFLLISALSYGQLTGTKTIPGNYSTIASAINSLNTAGVGSGGVTFKVAAGYTEVITARLNIRATGTVSNPIIFQKNGTGANPKITAFAGTATPTSAIPDGIWSLQGSDYVTIDGIDLYDPNTTNPATMEYGFGLFRNSAYDGAQHNTIKNCTVTLNRINNATGTSPMVEGSVCILVINSLPTTATSAFAPFDASGTNSYNRFYTNLLQNCNYGIVLTGSIAGTPFDLGDNGNDIGGSAISTGNTLLNFGGATAVSSPTAGVRAINQWELNISYNTINNNNGSGVNPVYMLYGINAESGTSANVNMNYNSISLKSSVAGYQSYGIFNGMGATPASNTININNNTIADCTSNGGFSGISCSSDAATVNINYNTISNISSEAITASLFGIYAGCNTNNPVNINIGNNHIFNLKKNISASHSVSVGGISYCALNANCHDNIVEDLSIYYSTYGSIEGIHSNLQAGTEIISNNIIRNCSITSVTSSTFYGIYASSVGNRTIQNNQIYGFIISDYGSFTGISASGQISNNQIHDVQYSGTGYLTGIYARGDGDVSANQIYAFTNPTGSTSNIYGIESDESGTVKINRNSIANLSSQNTGATIYGISLNYGTKNVYNNFISDLKTPNSALATAIAGINTGSSGIFNIYYNSVYLNTNSTGATFGTSAIYANTGATVDLRNNNLINTSIPNGGAYTCAYRRSGTTLTTYSGLSNTNNFYAGTPGLYRLIFYDGTNSAQTLATYKTWVAPRDAGSVTENPPFINTSTTPYNLHLSTSINTQCESHGTRITSPLAITDDVDANIRQGEPGYSGSGVAPDIGADEGNFSLADFDPPVIIYPLAGNSCATDRTITATITDLIGVPVTGSLVPRIYYRKNSGPWYSQPGTLASGTGLNGNWSLTIVASAMGGLAVGDVVSYFVIAQDSYTPCNISSTPLAGLVATNVNTVTAPPSAPNTYTILNSIGGVYQVGVGKTFATLTAAAAAYNNPSICLGTDVVFELTDATYYAAETFPIVFNENPFAGPGTTLTIRPAGGVTATISGYSSTSIIKFNVAKYITLDGSNSGGTDRSLTITNLYASSNTAAVWVGSTGTEPVSKNIMIKNCNISASITTEQSFGIIACTSTTMGNSGADIDNLVIRNNHIYKARYGVLAFGTTTGLMDNLQITQNTFGGTLEADYISTAGISVSYASGAAISQNTIFNIISPNARAEGVYLGTNLISSLISNNYIRKIISYGSYSMGIYINSDTPASNLTISNNSISEINGVNGSTITYSTTGIKIEGTISGINIYDNTINLNYLQSYSTVYYSMALLINNAAVSGIDVRDNILQNTSLNMGNAASRQYALYSIAPASAFTNINYNDYYVSGSQGILGYMGGEITTLAAWQTATGQDGSSKAANPGFVSTSDLHPSNADVDGAGLSISGISTDITGAPRGNPPDLGAYEFTPLPKTWNGSISTEWNNSLNWTPNGVPSPGTDVTVPAATPFACIVNTGGMVCNNIIIDGASFTISLASASITVYGNITFQNSASFYNVGTLTVKGDFVNKN